MNTASQFKITGLAAALACALSLPATADDLLSNGGFEAGLAGWTRADQIGGDGTFSLQTGTLSPVSGAPVPAPPGGIRAAMTDGLGPGSHVLYQDFVVPAVLVDASIGFSLFINNTAEDFVVPDPATLDFATTALNQQARVDILLGSADPFSVAAGDILQSLYQTQPGDPLVSGYDSHLFDITALLLAHPGETLRLRFAEADNVNIFNLGVDNVVLDARNFVIPEASGWMVIPVLAGLAGGCFLRRRRASNTA